MSLLNTIGGAAGAWNMNAAKVKAKAFDHADAPGKKIGKGRLAGAGRPGHADAFGGFDDEIECGNADARKADIQQAEDWTQKALGARKANVEKANKATKAGVDTSK